MYLYKIIEYICKKLYSKNNNNNDNKNMYTTKYKIIILNAEYIMS